MTLNATRTELTKARWTRCRRQQQIEVKSESNTKSCGLRPISRRSRLRNRRQYWPTGGLRKAFFLGGGGRFIFLRR